MAKGRFRAGARSAPRDVASEQFGAPENEEASHRVGLLASVPGLLRELGTDPA